MIKLEREQTFREVRPHMPKVSSIESAKELGELQRSNAVTVVDFYATWCGPCMMIKNAYAALASKYAASGCALVQCNVEEGDELAAKFRVTALPTFIIFAGETKVRCIQGADLAAVEDVVKGLVAKRASPKGPSTSQVSQEKKSKKKKKLTSQKETASAPKKLKKKLERTKRAPDE
jgi:thioredoxin 1